MQPLQAAVLFCRVYHSEMNQKDFSVEFSSSSSSKITFWLIQRDMKLSMICTQNHGRFLAVVPVMTSYPVWCHFRKMNILICETKVSKINSLWLKVNWKNDYYFVAWDSSSASWTDFRSVSAFFLSSLFAPLYLVHFHHICEKSSKPMNDAFS